MTSKEAYRAIGEVLGTTKDQKEIDHLIDLSDRILDKDVELSEIDKAVEKMWYEDMYGEED